MLFIIFNMGKRKNRLTVWSQQEERVLTLLVNSLGDQNWKQISVLFKKKYGFKKTNRECRQRWSDHLCPTIVKKTWAPDQKEILFKCHQQYGNKWSKISQHLPGRSQRDIKNHFYSAIRKSLRMACKIQGSKDSTDKIKQIKPKILSNIFEIGSTFFQQQMAIFSDLFEVSAKAKVYELIQLTYNEEKPKLQGENIKFMMHLIDRITQNNKKYKEEKKRLSALNKKKNLQRNFDKYINQDFQSQNSNISESQSQEQAQNMEVIEEKNIDGRNPRVSSSESTIEEKEQLEFLEISDNEITGIISFYFDQSNDFFFEIEEQMQISGGEHEKQEMMEKQEAKKKWWLEEPSLNLLRKKGGFFF